MCKKCIQFIEKKKNKDNQDKCYLKINCCYRFSDSQNDEGLLKGANFELIPIDEINEVDITDNAITDTFNGTWEANVKPGKYRIIISK